MFNINVFEIILLIVLFYNLPLLRSFLQRGDEVHDGRVFKYFSSFHVNMAQKDGDSNWVGYAHLKRDDGVDFYVRYNSLMINPNHIGHNTRFIKSGKKFYEYREK